MDSKFDLLLSLLQGFVVAVLYCFMNGEVSKFKQKQALWDVYLPIMSLNLIFCVQHPLNAPLVTLFVDLLASPSGAGGD